VVAKRMQERRNFGVHRPKSNHVSRNSTMTRAARPGRGAGFVCAKWGEGDFAHLVCLFFVAR